MHICRVDKLFFVVPYRFRYTFSIYLSRQCVFVCIFRLAQCFCSFFVVVWLFSPLSYCALPICILKQTLEIYCEWTWCACALVCIIWVFLSIPLLLRFIHCVLLVVTIKNTLKKILSESVCLSNKYLSDVCFFLFHSIIKSKHDILEIYRLLHVRSTT